MTPRYSKAKMPTFIFSDDFAKKRYASTESAMDNKARMPRLLWAASRIISGNLSIRFSVYFSCYCPTPGLRGAQRSVPWSPLLGHKPLFPFPFPSNTLSFVDASSRFLSCCFDWGIFPATFPTLNLIYGTPFCIYCAMIFIGNMPFPILVRTL